MNIFISYARKDGRELALRLRDDLIAAGHDVWLDTSEIEGGANWSHEIEQAIDHCPAALVLLSHGSYVSEICRAEQSRCRRKGKPIIPIRVYADTDIPLELEVRNYRDFSDARRYREMFDLLLADLSSLPGSTAAPISLPKRKVINTAPSLPKLFVERPEALDELRQKVMSDNNTDQQIALTALRGLGGIGKTILAAVLCHDEVIQDAFTDGIIWVEVGKKPAGGIVGIIQAIFEGLGDPIRYETSEQACINRLHGLLGEKSLLIVLDDVWSAEYIQPFLFDAPRCRVLITTRGIGVASLADEFGITEMRLGIMEPEQAQALLIQHLGHPDPTAPEIAARVGYLPLALKLVGARLKQTGKSGADWLKTFSKVDEIKAGGRQSNPKTSLEVCLDQSVEELRPSDRLLYYTLGAFPEDIPIPRDTAARLWRHLDSGLSEGDCDDLILALDQLALIEWHVENQTITLHDLLHDYNLDRLQNEKRLIATHEALLAAYNPPPTKPWPVCADSYLFDYLAYHLKEAEHYDDLRALFADQRWLRTRFEHDGYTYTGYLDDLMVAWRDVAHPQVLTQIEAHLEPAAIADCLRYALIHTSINSLAGNYVPELVARAVETGEWTAARALSVARRVPSAQQRAEIYTHLLEIKRVGSTQRLEAKTRGLETAFVIADEDSRVTALAALAPHLDNDLLRQALDAAPALADEYSRTTALAALAPRLEGDLLRQALDAALAIADEYPRATALAALVPHFDGEHRTQVLRQTLNAALAIADEYSRATALAALAPSLQGEQQTQVLRQALDAARAIPDKYSRATALAALAPYLDGEPKTQVLRQALDAALALADEYSRATALAALAPHLQGEHQTQVLRQVLDTVRAIPDKYSRATALATLAPYLDGKPKTQVLRQALDAALALADEYSRATALTALVPHLGGKRKTQVLHRALDTACAIAVEYPRARALTALAPHLQGEHQTQVLRQALDAARAIAVEYPRAIALAALAPYLDSDLLRQAIDASLAIADEYPRATALAALAPSLEGNLLRQALDASLAIADEYPRATALATLAPHLDGKPKTQVLRQALDTARAIDNEVLRATALAALAPRLEGDLLRQALDAARAIDSAHFRATTLTALAPSLEGDLKTQVLRQALDAALALADEYSRATALTALVPHLNGKRKTQVLHRALDTACAIAVEYPRARALTALAPHLDGKRKTQVLRQALDTALAIADEDLRAIALAALAPLLQGDLLRQALDTARAIDDEYSRAIALAALAPLLRGDLLRQALDTARAIDDEYSRARALAALALHLEGDLLWQTLDAARAIADEYSHAIALAAFLPAVADKPMLVRQIRATAVQTLFALRNENRSEILQFCGEGEVFAPPVFSPSVLAAFAWHVGEVCNEWTWL